jgi:flagellar motor switch protein FliM
VTGVLSNEQIAELVAAAKEGQMPEATDTRAARRGRRVRDIDLLRPTKFAQEQTNRIARAHEVFCRTADRRLSAELRVPIEFEVLKIDELMWANAMGEVPQPSIFAILVVDPLGTRMVLSAELPMVVWMMERMLGGGDLHQSHVPQRDLTEIELTLTRRLFAGIVEQLSPTWEELVGVQLSLQALESHLGNIHAALPSEPTLGITIEARTGASSWTISLAVPYPSIAGVVDKLSGDVYSEGPETTVDPAAAEAVRSALATVEVEMRAEVAATQLTIGEVLALRKGDVIRFGQPASAGIAFCADAVPIHRGKAGRLGSQRAIEILERLEVER